MTVTYPITVDSCTAWTGYTQQVQAAATAMAWRALRHLTGARVGNSPVLARPCRAVCADTRTRTGLPDDSIWLPMNCPHMADCGCISIPRIILPGPVAEVVSVVVGGVTLDPVSYRLHTLHHLVRLDGEWPLCQDLSQPADGDDAFAVTYIPGLVPGVDGQYVAGVLACEFAKAMQNEKCRLPSSVVAVARQGVSMEFAQGMFAGGVTGIREVDAYVVALNPNRITQPPLVWSPDRTPVVFHQ